MAHHVKRSRKPVKPPKEQFGRSGLKVGDKIRHFFFTLGQDRMSVPPEAGLMSRTRPCPKCHSTDVRPSHRKNFLERSILPLLRLRAYRCLDCDTRFLRHSTKADFQLKTSVPARGRGWPTN